MGRVLKLGKILSYFIKLSVKEKDDLFFRNFMITIIIKSSKNISCVSFFLFHTNVVTLMNKLTNV